MAFSRLLTFIAVIKIMHVQLDVYVEQRSYEQHISMQRHLLKLLKFQEIPTFILVAVLPRVSHAHKLNPPNVLFALLFLVQNRSLSAKDTMLEEELETERKC